MDLALAVVGIVLLAAGVIFLLGAESKSTGIGGLSAFTLIAALCLSGAFTYTLKANELGLEISRGRIGEATGPGGNPDGLFGAYTKSPLTTVEKFSSLPYTGEPVDVAMRSRDGGDFSGRFTPRWHTDANVAKIPGPDGKPITNLELLYRQANRTSDEAEITRKIVHLYIRNAAGDVANGIPTDSVYNDKGQVVETGVPNLSVTTFAELVKTKVTPELEKKGIILDEIVVEGKFNLSEKMQAQLDALSASRTKTRIALEDESTANAEARAAKARAGAATSVPNLTPEQAQIFCVQVWAGEMRRATEKGVPVYTNPCTSNGNGGVLVQAGGKQ